MPLGYKRKGARFEKEVNGFNYSIYIERSRWNGIKGHPDKLSVDIEMSGNNLFFSHSLFRITKLKFPPYYSPFFQYKLDWEEKGNLMASFSEEQVAEIDKYVESIQWHYSSEESLVELLEELKIQLCIVGLPAMDLAKEHTINQRESFEYTGIFTGKLKELYLMQLPPISRFPIE